MWAFWASDPRRRLALAVLVSLAAATPALARHVHVSVNTDSDRVVSSVRVDGRHIEVVGGGDTVSVGGGPLVEAGHGAITVDAGAGVVRLFSDADVKPGEHVDGDVVAVFGNVHVAGSVSGSAVAVFGSVDFGPQGKVDGDAVAVGGTVANTTGHPVSGETVSVGFLPLTLGLPALPTMLAFIGLGWLISVFFGWIFGALFPDRLTRIAVTSSRHTAGSLLIGLVSGPLVPIVAVLLLVTVVGIPLGVLLVPLYLALVYFGQLAALHLLGCKLLRKRPDEASGPRAIVAGSTFVAFFFVAGTVLWASPGAMRTVAVFFHLVGLLILAALSAVGTGAFLISRFGARPREAGSGEPVAGMAPLGEPPAPPGATPVTS